MHFTEVFYKNDYGYPALVFKHTSEGEGDPDEYWEMPFEAIANRIELYGLEGVEHAIEFLAQEVHRSETSDKHATGVTEAYTEVVNSEYAQTLMPTVMSDPSGPQQTVLNRVSITSSKRDKLSAARSQALEDLGVHTSPEEEPRVRVLATTQAQGGASNALDADDSAISQACALIEEHLDELEAWRLETPFNACPQLREDANREMDRIRSISKEAGLRGASV